MRKLGIAATLVLSQLFALPALSQRLAFRAIDDDFIKKETPVKKVPAKLFDLTEFLVPDLKYSDPLQYHFAGYGRCFYDTPDCRDENGVPIVRRPNFAKIARAENSPEGDTRFIFQKAPAHPNEYYIVKNELGPDGEPVRIVYIETETMDWTENQYARSYHTDAGYPTFEWGRSNAPVNTFIPQHIGTCTWTYCGSKPDEYEPQPSTPSGYVVRVFDLSKDIEAINKDLAELGPVEPKWLEMARATGKDPQLLVYQGYWNPVTGGVVGNNPALWWNRELYFYVKGLGFVAWRWQEHVDGDKFKPFQTFHEEVVDHIVWEDEPILPLAICEKVPGASSTATLGNAPATATRSPYPRPMLTSGPEKRTEER